MPPISKLGSRDYGALVVQESVLLLLKLRRSLVRSIQRLIFPRFDPRQPLRNVLVYRTGRLGDFLNALPALRLLRMRLPDARIVLATAVSSMPSMQSISSAYANLDLLPWLEFVMPSLVDSAMSFTMMGPDRGLKSLRHLIAEERPDVMFVLPYMGESLASRLKKLLFFRLAGFKGPIFGFEGLAARRILRRSQYRLGLYEHEVYGSVRAISECPMIGTVAEEEIVQRLTIPEDALRWARDVVNKSWLESRPLVAIAPGASFPHKMWPTDRYIAISRELHQEYGCRIVVVGSDADRPLGVRLEESLGACCLDMTGRTTITQLAALLSLCRLFVGNDSGPAHVASAVDCPCVTVTSAVDFPGIWEPWNSRGRIARMRIDCEFCLSLTCCPLKTNACILAIDTDEVLSLCRQVLGVPAPNCIDRKSTAASRPAGQL
jgi:ADP-heptose:LPS heptosyltransferase